MFKGSRTPQLTRSIATSAVMALLLAMASVGAGASGAEHDQQNSSALRPAEPASVSSMQDGGVAVSHVATRQQAGTAGNTARGLTPFFIYTEFGFKYEGEIQPLEGLRICLRKTGSSAIIECQKTDGGGAVPGFNLPQPGTYDLDVSDPQKRIFDYTHKSTEVPWINPFTFEFVNFEFVTGGLASQCDGEPADFIGTNGADVETYADFPPGALAQLKVGSVVQWHAGDDVVSGGSGKDRWCGGPGNDRITGNGNDDYLVGGSGNDVIIGGKGNDRLFGEAGKDKLLGRAGNDVMAGGKGKDMCNGGKGTDTKNSC